LELLHHSIEIERKSEPNCKIVAIRLIFSLLIPFNPFSPDEDEEPRCVQLTNQHKGAIRFIRKVSIHF
jgi:hypothetical protein